MRSRKDVIKSVLSVSQNSAAFIPDNCLDDDIIPYIYNLEPIYYKLKKKYRIDHYIGLRALYNGMEFKNLDKELKNNKELAMVSVVVNHNSYNYLGSLKEDPDIQVLYSFSSSNFPSETPTPFFVRYLSNKGALELKKLKEEHYKDEVLMEFLSRSEDEFLKYIPQAYLKEQWIINNLWLYSNDGAYAYLNKTWKASPIIQEFVTEKQLNLNNFRHLPKTTKYDPKVVERFFNKDFGVLIWTPKKLITYEMCKKAVAETGDLFKYFPKKNQNKELALLAVKHSVYAYSGLPDSLRKDTDIGLIASRHSNNLSLLDESLYTVENIKKNIIKNNRDDITLIEKFYPNDIISNILCYNTKESLCSQEFFNHFYNHPNLTIQFLIANHPDYLPNIEMICFNSTYKPICQIYKDRKEEWLSKIEQEQLNQLWKTIENNI